MRILSKFRNDEAGATAVEYGLLAAMFAVALLVGYGSLSTSVQDTLGEGAIALDNAADGPEGKAVAGGGGD